MAKNERSELTDELQEVLINNQDFLKEIVRIACQKIMEDEMTAFIGAEAHERTEERVGYRNGYKPRTLRTRVGELKGDGSQGPGGTLFKPSSSQGIRDL